MTNKNLIESDILLGITNIHIDKHYGLHKDIIVSFENLIKTLQKSGHQLKLVSAFRSFERQLSIWNQKASGKRDILDKDGQKLDYNKLSKKELLYSILRWSAIPGASRHHWGTDFDIIDESTLPENYHVQLTPEETNKGGPFFEMHNKIDLLIENQINFSFFRPYKNDKGGIAPERWHLSYRPLAQEFYKKYTYNFFLDFLNTQVTEDFLLLDLIRDEAKTIFDQYIYNISL